MRKNALLCLISLFALALVSWGYVGHRAVARVAENHLSPQAKSAIQKLLGSESIVEVASWADEARNDEKYKSTAPWHFLNLPLGLGREAFEKSVRGQSQQNVYSAVIAQEQVLKDQNSTREQKATSLKFLVHFIGDAHQPMHVSRAEDKGGNTIQLQYNGRGTNLHSLWDSRLIDQEGLSYSELAGKVDKATPEIIKQGADVDPMDWVWESYEISSGLYPEIEKNNKPGDGYYKAHIGIMNERLELAGLRLAAVLNAIYKNVVIPAAETKSPSSVVSDETAVPSIKIQAIDAANYTGKLVTLTSQAFSHSDKRSFVLVNLGAAYPGQLLTLVLRSNAKALGENIDGKTVTVTGKVIDYKGRPEIEVTDPAKLNFK